jgi:hypothetical protein
MEKVMNLTQKLRGEKIDSSSRLENEGMITQGREVRPEGVGSKTLVWLSLYMVSVKWGGKERSHLLI